MNTGVVKDIDFQHVIERNVLQNYTTVFDKWTEKEKHKKRGDVFSERFKSVDTNKLSQELEPMFRYPVKGKLCSLTIALKYVS